MFVVNTVSQAQLYVPLQLKDTVLTLSRVKLLESISQNLTTIGAIQLKFWLETPEILRLWSNTLCWRCLEQHSPPIVAWGSCHLRPQWNIFDGPIGAYGMKLCTGNEVVEFQILRFQRNYLINSLFFDLDKNNTIYGSNAIINLFAIYTLGDF